MLSEVPIAGKAIMFQCMLCCNRLKKHQTIGLNENKALIALYELNFVLEKML